VDLEASGRSIVDDNLYMVLATADADGRPWASPVYFASEDYEGPRYDHRTPVQLTRAG
jgi:nitroimidazol reductase NimA-like FMN-containing flavoprotein (pyridoxamine 5'-phosphate oxidase superfamily)